MRWEHKCSLAWLRARQDFLTATDVRELLPVTKTGKPRKVSDEAFMKVYSHKVEQLSEWNCYSYDAAARGHVLEPYAVMRLDDTLGLHLYHWDDTIVTKGLIPQRNHLAFSPDACDVPPLEGAVVCHCHPRMIAEIKSYYPDKHLVRGCTPKEDLEERWQLAVAMTVCESIEQALLVFYNPSLEKAMFVVEYSREDLKDEIELVLQVEQDWLTFIENLESKFCHTLIRGDVDDERKIMDEIERRYVDNPCS